MSHTHRSRNSAAAAWAFALAATLLVPAGPAAAATSVSPLLPVVAGQFTPAGVSYDGQWVWFRGEWLRDSSALLLDRTAGTTTEVTADWKYGARSGLVSDNPNLFLSVAPADSIYTWAGASLVNRTTGTSTRIDTQADGTPLIPAWGGTCDEECGPDGHPGVQVGPESVSQDGRWVAFCANFGAPRVFDYYVKDLMTGTLTARPGLCAAGWPVDQPGEYVRVYPPEMSNDSRVVHLRGALDTEEGHFYPDTVVFGHDISTRAVNGQGSMTRDGGSIFLRIGSYPFGTVDTTKGKVGVYNVKSGKTKKLTGKYRIYGSDALESFSAMDRASMRGRFVAYGNKLSVIDRKTGRKYNIAKILTSKGFPAPSLAQWNPLVSGDGTTLIARSADQYVAVKFR